MAPIKAGFVGLSNTGWASVALGPSLYKSPHFRLEAVTTSSPESAKTSADNLTKSTGHTVKGYHGSTETIANDPGVEFVAIAVKAPLHRQALLPVLEAGKNFFIEWPAGSNANQTREFAALAKEKGLRNIIGLQGRQNPAVKKIKEIIESGKIGRVLASSMINLLPRESRIWPPETTQRSVYLYDPANGATFIDIIGGHHLDLFTHALGEFASISATATQHYPVAKILDEEGKPTGETVASQEPDQFTFTGILKNGAIVSTSWRGGYASTPGRPALVWVIDGEEGSIRLEGKSAMLHISDADLQLYLNDELVEVPAIGLYGFLTSAWEEYVKGEEGKHATIEDAVRVRRLLEAIRLSLKEGRKVDL